MFGSCMQILLGDGQDRERGRDDAAFAPFPEPLRYEGIPSTSGLTPKHQLAWALA